MNVHGGLAALGLVVYLVAVFGFGRGDRIGWAWLVGAACGIPTLAGVTGVAWGRLFFGGGLSSTGIEIGALGAMAVGLVVGGFVLRERVLALADDVGVAMLLGVGVARLGCVVVGDLVLPSGFDPAPVYFVPVGVAAGLAVVRWPRAAFGELAALSLVLFGATMAIEAWLRGGVGRGIAAVGLVALGAGFAAVAVVRGCGRGGAGGRPATGPTAAESAGRPDAV